VRPSDGGWSAIVDGPRLDSDEATSLRLLTEAHVVVHPGYLFDLEQAGCLVLSLLPPPAVFSEGVRRIVSALGAC
jgi:alanine-synthesizing transaminase